MEMTKVRESGEKRTKQGSNRISAVKLMEVAFWGTVFWGIGRLVMHFLHFTPYGLGTFARNFFLNTAGIRTFPAILLGLLAMLVASFLASLVYSLLFSRSRVWWHGLLYGAVLLVVFGVFFDMAEWKMATVASEAAWFLTYGLFVGMTLSLERSDL